tara:strand:+ start:742 stop:1011 length:270 start_codon:yes stop_codon:yes gene_type:complete
MILMRKQNKKKEKIVTKTVQTIISMRSCLQPVIALPVVVQAVTQHRKLRIQRKSQIIRMVKRNLGGFLDLNNPPDFKNPQHQTNKKPSF